MKEWVNSIIFIDENGVPVPEIVSRGALPDPENDR